MLQSVKSVVDEIVAIVDDRTTDSTPDILRKHGAKVYFEKFNNSFSALRNMAVERSSYTWILALDDDEWLSDDLRKVLRELIESRNYDGYRFCRFNFHNPTAWPDRQLRLFMHYGRWKYRVHEVVVGLHNVLDTNYVIYHDSRSKPPERRIYQEELYRRLWELDLREGVRKTPYPSRVY